MSSLVTIHGLNVVQQFLSHLSSYSKSEIQLLQDLSQVFTSDVPVKQYEACFQLGPLSHDTSLFVSQFVNQNSVITKNQGSILQFQVV